jgi:hypothetical protein
MDATVLPFPAYICNGVAVSAWKKFGCLGIRLSVKVANSLHQMKRDETYQTQFQKKKLKMLNTKNYQRVFHEHLKYKKTPSSVYSMT